MQFRCAMLLGDMVSSQQFAWSHSGVFTIAAGVA